MVIHYYLYLSFLLIEKSRYALQGVSATCYTPQGLERGSPFSKEFYEYQPCNNSSKFSMCCALNRTSGPVLADRCRDDGLCGNSQGFAQLWRESCTDQSWLSPNCIKICLHGQSKYALVGCLRHFEAALAANRSLEAEEGISYKDTDVKVTECSDKSICCGWYNTTCCDKKEGVWIKDGFATTVDPSAARYFPIHSTSNSLSPTSLTSLPSPLPLASNSPPQSKPGVSWGQAVGGGIGSACGTAIILFSLYRLIRCFRSRRPSFPEQQKDFTPVQERQEITGVPNYELSGMVVRNELGGLNRVELGI